MMIHNILASSRRFRGWGIASSGLWNRCRKHRPDKLQTGRGPLKAAEALRESPAQTNGFKWLRIAGVFLGLALVAGIAIVGWWRYLKPEGHAIRSIAVLPLQNLSGDPSQEFLADGMTEELITELSRIEPLRVISHTSVMDYKGTKKHLPEIAKELNVDSILEGSVIRERDNVRVTVQLLDGPADRHLWSEEYERPLNGVLNLQRDVAKAVASEIRVKLTPVQQARLKAVQDLNPGHMRTMCMAGICCRRSSR